MLRNTFITAAVCGLALASTSFASESTVFDEIVVSAARVPLAISDVGNAITVITRDDIDRRQSLNVADLLRSVPGFTVSRSGVTGSQTQVRVRGAEANQILVLIDGNRVNDPGTADEFRWEYLSTAQIERIEIIRGAQSTLWGTDALGGVINIITRGSQDSSRVSGFAETGSLNSLNAGIDTSGQIKNWRLAGGLERQDTDGDNISRTGDEADSASLTTAYVNADWSEGDSVSVQTGVRLSDARSGFDGIDFVTGIPADSDSIGETESLTAHINGVFGNPDGNIQHRANIRWFDSNNDTLQNGISSGSTASQRLTLGYQFDVALGDNGMTLAVEHETTDFSQRGPDVFGDPNQDQTMDVASFVAEYRAIGFSRLDWIVSARYDRNSDFDNALNGRISGSFAATDSVRFRASVGTGRKNPTFTERFGFFPGSFIGNPALKPERSLSIDFGVDGSALNDALQWQATLFRQDLEDEINGFVFTENFEITADNRDGRSERKGVELATQWQISDDLGIDAMYTYVDATEPDASGARIDELRRPQHSAALGLNIDTLEGRLQSRVTAEYGGTRNDRFFPPFPAAPETVTIGNFWLLELTSRYAVSDRLMIYVRGSNLLDEEYEEVFGYRTLGRTAFVGARFRFSM